MRPQNTCLIHLGPDQTFTTPVCAVSRRTGGQLPGDLVLVGAGDLSLGGRTKPDGTIAAGSAPLVQVAPIIYPSAFAHGVHRGARGGLMRKYCK
jgi:hypothetical protein